MSFHIDFVMGVTNFMNIGSNTSPQKTGTNSIYAGA